MEQPDQQPEHAEQSSGQTLSLVSLLVALLTFPGCLFGGLTVLNASRDVWSYVSMVVLGIATILPIIALAKLHSARPAANGAEVPAIMALALVGIWWVIVIVVLGVIAPVAA